MAGRADPFLLAVKHHQAGRPQEAEQICRQILAASPRHADSLYMLGLIAIQRGEKAHGVTLIEQAIAQNGKIAAYHVALGEADRELGHLDAAETAFKMAIALQPKSAHAHYGYGRVLLDGRKYSDGVKAFQRAIAIAPIFAEAHNALGLASKALGNYREAAASYRTAIRLKPNSPEAQLNLGAVLELLSERDDALGCYKRALEIRPDYADAYNNLGSLCYADHRYDEALDYCRQALRLKPDHVAAHVNLGLALRMLGRFKEARASLNCAIELSPELPDPYIGLGMISEMEGQLDRALGYYHRALEISPDYPGAYWNESLSLLRHGELAKGWVNFEWRWKNPAAFNSPLRPFSQPKWQGENLGEGRLLIWAEQGVGDEILYAGLIPDLLARDLRLVLECDIRLVPLFARTWPQMTVIGRNDPPARESVESDVVRQAPMADLGIWLRPNFAAFPQRTGYLTPDWPKRQAFRSKLSADHGKPLVVGLSWISKNAAVGNRKSISLLDWAPILNHAGVRYVDLQYGDTAAERAGVQERLGVDIMHMDDLDTRDDLDGLAALISACDLVITVSNATAHLAGALGIPVWILIPTGIGQTWYWFTERSDSPWYPSARLFRQAAANDWAPVIKQVAKDLRKIPRG